VAMIVSTAVYGVILDSKTQIWPSLHYQYRSRNKNIACRNWWKKKIDGLMMMKLKKWRK
jgi:hypothetical protein